MASFAESWGEPDSHSLGWTCCVYVRKYTRMTDEVASGSASERLRWIRNPLADVWILSLSSVMGGTGASHVSQALRVWRATDPAQLSWQAGRSSVALGARTDWSGLRPPPAECCPRVAANVALPLAPAQSQMVTWSAIRPVHLFRSFPIKSPWVKLSKGFRIRLYGHENSHLLELRV